MLRTTPTRLDFPVTLVGDSTSLRAELTNPSRVSQIVPVQVPAPFAGPSSLDVPGGETVSFELLFLPTTVGTFSATVTLGSEPATQRLELNGAAVAPVTCAPAPAACRVMKATAEGTCVEVAATEDSACSTPCIQAGICRQGQCLGAARSCDDSNACTTEACAEETGCVHAPTTRPSPSNPCQAASCDPRTGCSVAEVLDGTGCGPNTCVTAKVCVSGECREVSAPEGSTCAPATLCRSLASDTQLILLLRDSGSTTGGHRVEARSAVDGTLQWSRSRADFVAPLGLPEGVALWMMSAGVVGTPPRVFLNLRINEGAHAGGVTAALPVPAPG